MQGDKNLGSSTAQHKHPPNNNINKTFNVPMCMSNIEYAPFLPLSNYLSLSKWSATRDKTLMHGDFKNSDVAVQSCGYPNMPRCLLYNFQRVLGGGSNIPFYPFLETPHLSHEQRGGRDAS